MANRPKAKSVKRLAKTRLETAKDNARDTLYLAERREFLDKFTLCDVTCKAYVEKYKKAKKVDDKGKEIKPVLDMRIIPTAFAYFDMSIDKHILTPVFGADKGKGHRSCKKIRDALVHSLSSAELEEMHERYSSLIKQMDAFLAYFQ